MTTLILAVLLFTSPVLAAQPNVILITIDTLRADYLGTNGSKKVKTPNLDALAAQGANVRRARSAVPLTLPSHASILTGLYPPNHGIRDNATFRLNQNVLTLAEVLKKKGYRTAAFVGSFVLDHRFGLDQGFDFYEDRTWSDANMLEHFEAERNAETVRQAVVRWLRENSGTQPLFLWIHFYDPHAPYIPPEPFRSRYPRDPYA
ncbi:MAG: sulfatase, partial [Acidobacteriota bacterium]